MIPKRILVPDRLRRPPREGFSWVDRRFVREYSPLLSREAILLYFFLAAVSDKHGLSFWGDAATAGYLKVDVAALVAARVELVQRDLIAVDGPLVQVLALPAPATRRDGPPQSLGDALRAFLEGRP